jgi:hypothetical protein
MKIKKTVTDKVMAANRTNAQKATGPQNTERVSQNARQHALLSKQLVFETEEEKEEFNTLMAELSDEHRPMNRTDMALVEEEAIVLWKLGIANGLEMQELANRRSASLAIMETLAKYEGEQLPLFGDPDGLPSAARLGWDCQELLVRSGTRKCAQEGVDGLGDKNGKTGHVQIEAKLSTTLDTILRYQATLKRDLYRVIAALRPKPRDGSGE